MPFEKAVNIFPALLCLVGSLHTGIFFLHFGNLTMGKIRRFHSQPAALFTGLSGLNGFSFFTEVNTYFVLPVFSSKTRSREYSVFFGIFFLAASVFFLAFSAFFCSRSNFLLPWNSGSASSVKVVSFVWKSCSKSNCFTRSRLFISRLWYLPFFCDEW